MAGAANRCVIPEHAFDIEQLCELLVRRPHLEPEPLQRGARLRGRHDRAAWTEMMFEGSETDMFGHKKLGGIGDVVAAASRSCSPEVQQRAPDQRHQPAPRLPGALRRPRRARLDRPDGLRQPGARPDPRAAPSGRLVNVRNGRYDNVPIEVRDQPQEGGGRARSTTCTDRLRPLLREVRGNRRCSS